MNKMFEDNLSPIRNDLLSKIRDSLVPLPMKTLVKKMEGLCDQSTVYRAMDYFEREGLVFTITFGGVKHYYSQEKSPHSHFIYCSHCQEIRTFDSCSISSLQKNIEREMAYSIKRHVIYFEGLCEVCEKSVSKIKKNSLKG